MKAHLSSISSLPDPSPHKGVLEATVKVAKTISSVAACRVSKFQCLHATLLVAFQPRDIVCVATLLNPVGWQLVEQENLNWNFCLVLPTDMQAAQFAVPDFSLIYEYYEFLDRLDQTLSGYSLPISQLQSPNQQVHEDVQKVVEYTPT
ncbi:hypothetical protein D8674_037998 [Pyrus ussuriensis x Pyrus communis]|uniref:Uncharacterized protein n=1 Tax=Pyrus ussuriensis x Pyrus communis TaxID=2448454 RepID=A0A5N5FNE1_9ROSA|nr:hypothetical protein D8674_037998 [Pyrus ussuriensis x Pyrus communis]